MKEFNRLQGIEGEKTVLFSKQGFEAFVNITHESMGVNKLREIVMIASDATGVDSLEIFKKLRDGGHFDWPDPTQQMSSRLN